MILNDIKEKLQAIDPNVFYGAVDNAVRETVWDYTVFERTRIAISSNKTSYSYYFTVHIVRENFIPEGVERSVIDSMCEIAGMRIADSDPVYTYAVKPNTNTVVEMLSIDFVKPVKV